MKSDGTTVVSTAPSWSEWMGTGLMVLIGIGMVLAIWMILRRSRGSRPSGAPPAEVETYRAPPPEPGDIASGAPAEPAAPIPDEPLPAAAPFEASPAAQTADL